MAEDSIVLKVINKYSKRIFAIKEDTNNIYVMLRDNDGDFVNLTKIPRIKLYENGKLVLDSELEVIDASNGIVMLTLSNLKEGIYKAKIELDHKRTEHLEEFFVVVQE